MHCGPALAQLTQLTCLQFRAWGWNNPSEVASEAFAIGLSRLVGLRLLEVNFLFTDA